jgi:hypothetical protein
MEVRELLPVVREGTPQQIPRIQGEHQSVCKVETDSPYRFKSL